MPLGDAIKQSKDGVILDFDVSPGAKTSAVPSGYSEWRNRIEAKLRAPPEKGRANEELIESLSSLFNVPSSSIEITSGATNSRKSVLIRGIVPADAERILRGKLG